MSIYLFDLFRAVSWIMRIPGSSQHTYFSINVTFGLYLPEHIRYKYCIFQFQWLFILLLETNLLGGRGRYEVGRRLSPNSSCLAKVEHEIPLPGVAASR